MEEIQSPPDKGESIVESLSNDVNDMYLFRDLFFENHPIEMANRRQQLLEEKVKLIEDKINKIDENEIPPNSRAKFLYLKGRAYNIGSEYSATATQCLSRAVKLNPRLADAWNELGDSYWKNKNVKEARNCFEGALLYDRNRVALRSLSIILRQTASGKAPSDHKAAVERSVALAKEAVGHDTRDGASWVVLGNAYLCKYFAIAQEPATLKACLSAYRQAKMDPVARGQSDLYYNSGVALKYDERYQDALSDFTRACDLDPGWAAPAAERARLWDYLARVAELVRTRGKIKTKRLAQMVQSLSEATPPPPQQAGSLQRVTLADLEPGDNSGRLVVGKVVGSIYTENIVPFTFALTDASGACAVTVYNWADGGGVIIGDTVSVPRPALTEHRVTVGDKEHTFRSIRVATPLALAVNGRRVSRAQHAGTRATSTYETR